MAENKKTTKQAWSEAFDGVKEMANQVVEAAVITTQNVAEMVENDPHITKAVEQTKKAAGKVVTGMQKMAKDATDIMSSDERDIIDSVEIETYIQYQGKEFYQISIAESVINEYLKDGHEKNEIQKIRLYIKPEESAVYYVINDDAAGKLPLSIGEL